MPLRTALILCVMFSATAAHPGWAAEPTPDIEWTVVDDGERPGLSNPCFSDGLVIVGNDAGALRAFNATTGADVWRFNQPGRIYRRPEADARSVYGAAEFGAIFAVNRDDGKLVWRRQSDLGFGALAVDADSGLLFAAGNDGHVRALDSATGDERWSADILNDAPPDRPVSTASAHDLNAGRPGRRMPRATAAPYL